ncbi:MAG: MFS transporter, partial [Promethearchaeota archaeon]
MSTAFRSMGLSIVEIGLQDHVFSLGGSLIEFGMIIGIFSLTQCILQYPYAAASDKYGRRKIVLIGMVIYITGTFLCYFAQDILQLIIYRGIQGAGAYTSILQAIIGDLYKKDEHSKGMGYYSLYMNLGFLLGLILGGYIASYLEFRDVFSISGFLTLITGIFIFFTLKEKNQDEGSIQNKNLDFNLSNIKILFNERQYNLAVILNSVRWFLFGFITPYLIWILQDPNAFNLSQIDSSYYVLYIVVLYVVFVFISGKLLIKYGPRKMMIIGQSIVILFGIFFFFPILMENLIFFMIIISFLAIGIALFDPAGNTLLLEVIEDVQPDLKGSGIGLNNAIGLFFGAIAPMIMSPLGEIQIFIPFYVVNGLMIFSLIITGWF